MDGGVKVVTTTIPLNIWNEAKSKHLRWNECLIAGIKKQLGEEIPLERDVTIVEEGVILKKDRAIRSMQNYIDSLNSQLENVKGVKPNVA